VVATYVVRRAVENHDKSECITRMSNFQETGKVRYECAQLPLNDSLQFQL
jgi:hypothetical protein